MVHIHCTACKNIGDCLTVRQMAPRGTPRQQEDPIEPPQHELVESQQEESPELEEVEPTEPQLVEDVIHS
jgi:hypothetical protein